MLNVSILYAVLCTDLSTSSCIMSRLLVVVTVIVKDNVYGAVIVALPL